MDRLSKVLERFPLQAGVFYTGGLCGVYDFDRAIKPGHFHLLRGGGVQFVDAQEVRRTIDQPSVVFLPDASTHRLIAEQHTEVMCATVHFGGSANSPIVGALPPLVVVDIASSVALRGLVGPIFNEAQGARQGRQQALNLLCALVVVEVLRHCIETGVAHGGVLAGLADARLSRPLEAIHAQPQRNWTLQEMASIAGMSRSRFAVAFREVIGVTPGEHLLACRLAEARALLRRGEKLKQIAPKVGYASIAALTRALARKGDLPVAPAPPG